MKDKYLPVGSVVLLNGGTKKVMITGFCTIAKEQPDKMFDYCGCLYPEGVIRSDQNCVFNHDQIKEIFFEGYISNEEKDFKKQLKAVLEERTIEIPSLDDDNVSFEKLDDEIERL